MSAIVKKISKFSIDKLTKILDLKYFTQNLVFGQCQRVEKDYLNHHYTKINNQCNIDIIKQVAGKIIIRNILKWNNGEVFSIESGTRNQVNNP